MTDARTKAIWALSYRGMSPKGVTRTLQAIDDAGLVLIDPTTFGDIVEERLAQAGAWRAELETASYGDDPDGDDEIDKRFHAVMDKQDEGPSRATFADGTEARDLNVGRLGLCGPEAMREAIEREEEQ